jgi:hypothetical protein
MTPSYAALIKRLKTELPKRCDLCGKTPRYFGVGFALCKPCLKRDDAAAFIKAHPGFQAAS